MKFKKIMLITLLLLAVLTIGAASAADDVDALAVDDVGDETVVEAPADEMEVGTSVVDEDVVEAEENTDTLASPYASFSEEVYSDYHTVVSLFDYSDGINGTVTLFANDTQVFNQKVVEDDSLYIYPGNLTGSFYGTYNMKVVYNPAEGTIYEQTGTVTFSKLFKKLTPEEFNVTFMGTEIDLDKGGVILKYIWPEGVKEHLSQIEVRYGEGEYDRQIFSWDPDTDSVNVYKNVTCGNLYIWDKGVYNISVYYDEYFEHIFPLGNITITVVDNHEYTAEDIIYIYDYVGNGYDEDWLAEIYDGEIEGLDGVVTAYANGAKIYTKTYSNSTRGGPINVKNLTGSFNGVYNVTVEYKRTDGKVFAISRDVYFDNIVGEGDPIKTTITVSPTSVSMTYKANKNLVATLKDANNKPIKDADIYINVMGVTYPVKTDKNGQVKMSLSSLPVKKHTITFTFKDTAPYKGSSKKAILGLRIYTRQRARATFCHRDKRYTAAPSTAVKPKASAAFSARRILSSFLTPRTLRGKQRLYKAERRGKRPRSSNTS